MYRKLFKSVSFKGCFLINDELPKMPVIDEQVDYGVDAMVQIFADVGNWLSTERLGLAKNYLECAVGIRLNFNIVADISGIPCPVLIFIRPNNFWHLQSLVNTSLRDIYAEVVRRETLTHCENIEVFVHDIGFVECSDHVPFHRNMFQDSGFYQLHTFQLC